MLSASRYVLAGHPRNCAFCREPLTTQAHRRNNTYFCNELCADAAAQMTDTPRLPGRDLVPSRPRVAPTYGWRMRLPDADVTGKSVDHSLALTPSRKAYREPAVGC